MHSRAHVAIGDSAGAHFGVPAAYVNASLIDATTFDDALSVLADEV